MGKLAMKLKIVISYVKVKKKKDSMLAKIFIMQQDANWFLIKMIFNKK